MAGEDLDEGDDGGTNDTAGTKGKKGKKPLSKGQKIGVVIGAVTILLVIYQIKKSSASTTAAAAATTGAAPIDPQTGYPSGSAEDQQALASMSSGSTTGGLGGYGSGTSSSIDPANGMTYASEIQGASLDPATGMSYSTEFSTLGTNYTALEQQLSTLQGDFTTYQNQPPTPSATTSPGSGIVSPGSIQQTLPPAPEIHGPTAQQSKNLANLSAQLKRDSAGSTAADRSSVARLDKQIAAVKARS